MNLNQVSVGCSDLKRSISFYELLGLSQIVGNERYARFEFPGGDSTFSIERVEKVVPGTTGIYFECADLDHRVAQLKASGMVFEGEPTDMPWKWREAWLRDPDGNRICLFWAGENRRNPPWRMKG